jgi:hypothetical protein
MNFDALVRIQSSLDIAIVFIIIIDLFDFFVKMNCEDKEII